MLTERIITKEFEDYKKFNNLYCSAFPKSERLPVKFLMEQGRAGALKACYDEEVFCGFYSTLTFGDITHILFLAVDDKLRGHGYGSSILELISNNYSENRIILDIEAEDLKAENNEQRIKRKEFYEKNGYVESGVEYNWRGVSYKILIKNGTITDGEFWRFWDNI